MVEYASASRCLETQLRMALDDDVDPAFKCGRCSVCTGELPHGLTSRPDNANIVTAQRFLRGVDHPIESRKRWAPGLMVPGLEMRNSTITKVSLERRALAYGDDAAWCAAIDALRFDGDLSDDLREGVRERSRCRYSMRFTCSHRLGPAVRLRPGRARWLGASACDRV